MALEAHLLFSASWFTHWCLPGPCLLDLFWQDWQEWVCCCLACQPHGAGLKSEISKPPPQVIVDIEEMDPGFLEDHPGLHFELQAAHFQQLLDSGDTKAALALARSQLATISDRHMYLQPQFKVYIPHDHCLQGD